MIFVRTPLRVSFFGGGTDFREFHREHGGAVLSAAIDRYVHVCVGPRFDDRLRVGYTDIELVDSVDDIRHDLVRECLKRTGIDKGVEVVTIADVPAGSGLGSSSTVTVGLLHAMHTLRGVDTTAESLAREACDIEIDVVGKPIGIQDQYIAAYGGTRFLRFHEDGRVDVDTVVPGDAEAFQSSLLLFYTGVSRQAETILAEQRRHIPKRTKALLAMAELAERGRERLEAGDTAGFGALLHEGWMLKKGLASRISSPDIDARYEAARRAGAWGGKITGAGGGGFLLLAVPPDRRAAVRAALDSYRELPLRLSPTGSTVLVVDG